MPVSIVKFIAEYGYLSIFLLVFIQEIGVPTFPNEIALLYFGKLCYQGLLYFFYAFAVAVAADVIGTFLVYILFYFFSNFFKRHRPKWLSFSANAIQSFRKKISRGGIKNIFIGRLTPYVRGYTSVVAGILHINTKKYLPTVIASAIVWSGGYVTIGYFIAPYWNKASSHFSFLGNVLIIIPVVLILWYSIKFFSTKKRKHYE